MHPLLIVDDILTVSKCSPTASALNVTVNSFIESKKLKLSHKKCCAIHVGKSNRNCHELKVHGENMHRETSTKYLGDTLHNSGKTKFNILQRSAKAHAILAEICAILTDVPLGKYRTEAGLQLRQAMFVNGVLYNSETWQGLGTTDLTILENIDHQLIHIICDEHAKTPVEFLYLESGCLQLKNMVSMHRIMYLHHILNISDSELIKRVFSAQREIPTPGDFVELVKSDLQAIGEAKFSIRISLNKKLGWLLLMK